MGTCFKGVTGNIQPLNVHCCFELSIPSSGCQSVALANIAHASLKRLTVPMLNNAVVHLGNVNIVARLLGTVPKSIQLVQRNPSLWKPQDSKLIWKDFFFLKKKEVLKAAILTVAAKLKVLTCNLPEVLKNLRTTIWDLGGFLDCDNTTMSFANPSLWGVIFFYISKQIPICFSCSWECCNAALLCSSRDVSSTKLHLMSHQHSIG